MASSQSVLLLLMSILSVVLVVDGGVVRAPASETKIVGGYQIEINKAPWQVYLQIKDYMCGGSIISDRWVISAAHCTYKCKPSSIKMLIGTKSLTEGGTKYHVEKVVNHKRYSDMTILNDISLLKSAVRMNLDAHNLRPVKLPDLGAKSPDPGTLLQVTGWGEMEGHKETTLLMAVDIRLQDFKECKFLGMLDASKQLCAFSLHKDSCYGDSGGPLVKGDLLVGLVSFGDDESECGDRPSIYTDVAAYRGWIKKHSGV